jgi:serine/threonine-protein kinase
MAPPTPLQPMSPIAHDSAPGYPVPRSDEPTDSKMTGSRFTGTMGLPVDKRLPILASALGLAVLLVIMGVVLLGRGPDEAPGPSTSASGSASSASHVGASSTGVGTGASATVTAATGTVAEGTSATPAVADPAPPSSVDVVHPADPKPVPPPPPIQHVAPVTHAAPRPPPVPVKATAAPPPPPPRRNCDPPYTLDANGRKKYKLECM